MNCNNNIYKCLECSLIPFYCIKYQNKKIYVEQRCQKNHYYFEEFRNFYNNKKCKNINNIKNYCEKHNNNFQFYCKDCKINICLLCSNEHKKHNLIDLINEVKNFDINIYKKQIEKAENELNLFTKNCNKIYNQLQEFIKDFNLKFKNFLQFNIEQLSFTKDIINIYNYFNKKKEFSYEIIFNIKNIINLKELSYEIDEEFSLLTKSQKFYSIISNNYNTFLNTSNTEINIYYQISEKEKNYLLNKLPPLKDNIPIIYIDKILLQTCNYYYGECQVNTNIKHGRGIIVYKDGGKFIGYFKNGVVEGFGIKYSKNGEIEYGYWKNDNPIGYRTHYYLNGDILKNKIAENEKEDDEEDKTTFSIYKWEIYIKENGKTIILKDMEFIIYQMEINMKENGIKIIKKDWELKYGQMVKYIQDYGKMIPKMGLEKLFKKQDIDMKGNLNIIIIQEEEFYMVLKIYYIIKVCGKILIMMVME